MKAETRLLCAGQRQGRCRGMQAWVVCNVLTSDNLVRTTTARYSLLLKPFHAPALPPPRAPALVQRPCARTLVYSIGRREFRLEEPAPAASRWVAWPSGRSLCATHVARTCRQPPCATIETRIVQHAPSAAAHELPQRCWRCSWCGDMASARIHPHTYIHIHPHT